MPFASIPSPVHPDDVTLFVNRDDPSKKLKLDLGNVPTGSLLKLLAPALSGEHTILVGEYDPAFGALVIR